MPWFAVKACVVEVLDVVSFSWTEPVCVVEAAWIVTMGAVAVPPIAIGKVPETDATGATPELAEVNRPVASTVMEE